ncbi:MAG: glycoside hydrolase family 2 TIM barrel-domain containing protein [Muribaculaceae bacterium]
MPLSVQQVSNAALSLNGKWQFRIDEHSSWAKIDVPGEAAMQGFGIKHDTPFYYQREVKVPRDFAGKTVILRFDGVYGHAMLFVNGKQVREHHGGFTRWETDVTRYVKPGKSNKVMLVVEDRIDDISYASGYAHHPIGGILRGVTLFALPQSHLRNVAVDASLTSDFSRGVLAFSGNYVGTSDAELQLVLRDAASREVASHTAVVKPGDAQCGINVPDVNKWDAEHPYQYTLEVRLCQDGKTLMHFNRMVGFRNITVDGSRLLVNGKPVKLRGACRHDIHPTLGRSITRQLDSLDVVLFKQANMNFVRTSHYPPSEDFVEFCDRYGIYVECESAVCFVNTHRQRNYAPAASNNDPAFASKYMSQLQEMVSTFRSHPSVLIWSLGNESDYGSNFKASYDYVKQTDASRPVIYSYPGLAQKHGAKIFDILSMHYPGVEGNMEQYGMITRGFQGHNIPALFDEWAHPACYTYATLRDDPNIREFWGKSLDMMWSGVFASDGALGGAIWGYIDETFSIPALKAGAPFWKEFARTAKPEGYRGDCVGYGEWGIVDVWRRLKPEFWGTKKAYSPVRVLNTHVADFTPGAQITLTVHNRFDHTNLNEIKASFTFHNERHDVSIPSIEPHQKGLLLLPGQQWAQGDSLSLQFYAPDGMLIDSYCITVGDAQVNMPQGLAASTLTVDETADNLVVKGGSFTVPFSKSTGMMVNAAAGGETVIAGGPYLNVYVNLNHLSGAEVRKIADHIAVDHSQWKLGSISHSRRGNDAVGVRVCGTYGDVDVQFDYVITSRGEISIDYTANGLPNGYLRESGVMFNMPQTAGWVQWQRRGYWDSYPEHSMSGNEGAIGIYDSRQSAYGKKPSQPWAYDTRNYYYWSDAGANCSRPLNNVAKAMKENVYYYTLKSAAEAAHGVSVVSRGASLACRLNTTPQNGLLMYVNTAWDYPEIAWGNYCKTVEALPVHGTLHLQLQ